MQKVQKLQVLKQKHLFTKKKKKSPLSLVEESIQEWQIWIFDTIEM